MASSVEQDLRAIEEIRAGIESAENAGDVSYFRGILADDAVMLVPDFPVQTGRDACVSFLEGLLPGLLEYFDRRITYTSAEVRVLGDTAFDRGGFAFTVRPRSGGATDRVTGKYLWLYARSTDGAWQLSRAAVTRDDPEEAPTIEWRKQAGRIATRLALAFGLFLGVAEIVRNWGDWGFWPFWVVDYIAVALLLFAWRQVRHERPGAGGWLAGAWGFTSAMFYMSFFSHVAQLDRPDHGPIEHRTLTAIIGALFALTVFAFACSLAGLRTRTSRGV